MTPPYPGERVWIGNLVEVVKFNDVLYLFKGSSGSLRATLVRFPPIKSPVDTPSLGYAAIARVVGSEPTYHNSYFIDQLTSSS